MGVKKCNRYMWSPIDLANLNVNTLHYCRVNTMDYSVTKFVVFIAVQIVGEAGSISY